MYNIYEDIATIQNRLDHLDNWEFNIQMSDRITADGWAILRKIDQERTELKHRLARLETLI